MSGRIFRRLSDSQTGDASLSPWTVTIALRTGAPATPHVVRLPSYGNLRQAYASALDENVCHKPNLVESIPVKLLRFPFERRIPFKRHAWEYDATLEERHDGFGAWGKDPLRAKVPVDLIDLVRRPSKCGVQIGR